MASKNKSKIVGDLGEFLVTLVLNKNGIPALWVGSSNESWDVIIPDTTPILQGKLQGGNQKSSIYITTSDIILANTILKKGRDIK